MTDMARNFDDHARVRNRFGLIFTDYLRRRFHFNGNQERVQDVEQFQAQENFSEFDEFDQDRRRGCADVVRLLISAGDSIDGLHQVTTEYITETAVRK